jgi:arylsulfatase A-like enzyme
MYCDCDIPAPVWGEWLDGDDCPYACRASRERMSYDLLTPEVIRAARAAYYGLITQIDYNLGRVFSALQDMDLFRDTLIIYTSDHGAYLGDHKDGSTGFFHESTSHLPFVLRMPQSWQNRLHGTQSPALVTLADILPTLVAAAGGTPPAGLDGMDLIAVARGAAASRPYLEAITGPLDLPSHLAITDGRWKYLWYPVGGSEQLFDLETDPHELKNLAGRVQFTSEHQRLQQELIRRHTQRSSVAVCDGKLAARPLPDETVADRRNQSWPGYHTEFHGADVRH